jgi:hypothetical protein
MRVYGLAARSLLPVVLVALHVALVPAHAAPVSVPVADLAVITNPESATETRSLMRFDLPEELAGATIEFAVVEFTASVSSSDAAGVLTLDAFPVTTEWSGDSAVWAEGWSTPGGDFERSVHAVWTTVSGESSVVRLDATDMVAGWASGAYPNRGLLVRTAPGETGTAEPVGAAGDRGAPMLTIWYTGPERHGRR